MFSFGHKVRLLSNHIIPQSKCLNFGVPVIDYVRAWQDDPPLTVDSPATPTVATAADGGLVVNDEDSKAVLADFVARHDSLVQNDNLTRMDRLGVGLEIITPAITAEGLKIDSISALSDLINLKSDVVFFGRPYFNTDTAGFALVKERSTQVSVTYGTEYAETPIVNVTLNSDDQKVQQIFGDHVQYAVIDSGTKGFTITVDQPARADTTFSWTAFAVNGAKTATSGQGYVAAQVEPSIEPSTPAVPSSDPTVSGSTDGSAQVDAPTVQGSDDQSSPPAQ